MSCQEILRYLFSHLYSLKNNTLSILFYNRANLVLLTYIQGPKQIDFPSYYISAKMLHQVLKKKKKYIAHMRLICAYMQECAFAFHVIKPEL